LEIAIPAEWPTILSLRLVEQNLRLEFDLPLVIAQPDQAFLDGALQAHGALRQAGQRLAFINGEGKHAQVLLASHLAGRLLPPDFRDL
jgi:hypothetical protein